MFRLSLLKTFEGSSLKVDYNFKHTPLSCILFNKPQTILDPTHVHPSLFPSPQLLRGSHRLPPTRSELGGSWPCLYIVEAFASQTEACFCLTTAVSVPTFLSLSLAVSSIPLGRSTVTIRQPIDNQTGQGLLAWHTDRHARHTCLSPLSLSLSSVFLFLSLTTPQLQRGRYIWLGAQTDYMHVPLSLSLTVSVLSFGWFCLLHHNCRGVGTFGLAHIKTIQVCYYIEHRCVCAYVAQCWANVFEQHILSGTLASIADCVYTCVQLFQFSLLNGVKSKTLCE